MGDDTPDDRLRDVERTLERVVVLLEQLTTDIRSASARDAATSEKLNRVLHGDGNGSRGLMVRLDRLEQAQERQRWLTRLLVTSVVTLLVRAAWQLLTTQAG